MNVENRRYAGPRKTVLRYHSDGQDKAVTVCAGDEFTVQANNIVSVKGTKLRLTTQLLEKLTGHSVLSGARSKRAGMRGRKAPTRSKPAAAAKKPVANRVKKAASKPASTAHFKLSETTKSDFTWYVYGGARMVRIAAKTGSKQLQVRKGMLFGLMSKEGARSVAYFIATEDGVRFQITEADSGKVLAKSQKSRRRMSGAFGDGAAAAPKPQGSGIKVDRSDDGASEPKPTHKKLADMQRQDFTWYKYKGKRRRIVTNANKTKQVMMPVGGFFGIAGHPTQKSKSYILDEAGNVLLISNQSVDNITSLSAKTRKRFTGPLKSSAEPAPETVSPDEPQQAPKTGTPADITEATYTGRKRRFTSVNGTEFTLSKGQTFWVKKGVRGTMIKANGPRFMKLDGKTLAIIEQNSTLAGEPSGEPAPEPVAPMGQEETVQTKFKYTGNSIKLKDTKNRVFGLKTGDVAVLVSKGGRHAVKIGRTVHLLSDKDFRKIEGNLKFGAVEDKARPVPPTGMPPQGAIRRPGAENLVPDDDTDDLEPGDYIPPGTQVEDIEIEDVKPRGRKNQVRIADLADKKAADEQAQRQKAGQKTPATEAEFAHMVDSLREAGLIEDKPFASKKNLIDRIDEISVPEARDEGVDEEAVATLFQFFVAPSKLVDAIDNYVVSQGIEGAKTGPESTEPEAEEVQAPEEESIPTEEPTAEEIADKEPAVEMEPEEEPLDDLDEELEDLEPESVEMDKFRHTQKGVYAPTADGSKVPFKAGTEWEVAEVPGDDGLYDAVIDGTDVKLTPKIANALKKRSEAIVDEDLGDLSFEEEDENP